MSASLLGLPGELRNSIYTFYVASNARPHALNLVLRGSVPAHLEHPPLAHVCHQIRSELLSLWKTLDIFCATRLLVLIENLNLHPFLAFLHAQGQRGRLCIEHAKLIFRFMNAGLIARHGKTAAQVWPRLDFTRVSGLYHSQRWAWSLEPRRTRLPPRLRCYAELDWIGLGGDGDGAKHAAVNRRVAFDSGEKVLAKIARRAEEVVSQGLVGRRAKERAFRTWLKLELVQ